MRLYCIALILGSLLLAACATADPERTVTPDSYEEAAALYRRGHELFIAGRYDQAAEAYGAVDRFIEKNPRFRDYFDHSYRGFSMVEMVRRYEKLGDINPETVHRILILYIGRTEASFGHRLLSARFTEDLKETERISRQVCRMLLAVLSDGRLGLEFEEISLDTALTELEASDPRDNRFPADRAVESLDPYPGELLDSRMKDCDSFVFYWNHRDDAGEEIYGGPHGWGGVSRIPVIPYQSYGPPRGRILISAGLINRPGTLLHELFHTFEKSMGIAPIHGFWDKHRHHFPGWKGEGELDYYQYHLSRLVENPGYGNFLLSNRYPAGTLPEFLEREEIRKAILPPAARRESFLLASEAKRIDDLKRSETLNRQALELNPQNGAAHLGLSIYFHQKKEREPALYHALKAFRLDPFSAEAAYWAAVCYYNSGKPVLSLEAAQRAMELNPSMKKARVYYEFVKSRAEASQ